MSNATKYLALCVVRLKSCRIFLSQYHHLSTLKQVPGYAYLHSKCQLTDIVFIVRNLIPKID